MAFSKDYLSMYEVREGSDCWWWTGAVHTPYGYPIMGAASIKAHRFFYEVWIGEIGPDLDAHHVCENKLCVNPEHIELLTRSEHVKRHVRPKTHCKRGHPLSGDNLRIRTKSSGNGERCCRACARIHQRAYDKRRRAKP